MAAPERTFTVIAKRRQTLVGKRGNNVLGHLIGAKQNLELLIETGLDGDHGECIKDMTADLSDIIDEFKMLRSEAKDTARLVKAEKVADIEWVRQREKA